LYNPSATAINLAGYKLSQFSNGVCTQPTLFRLIAK
jgi:hypothetical protein